MSRLRRAAIRVVVPFAAFCLHIVSWSQTSSTRAIPDEFLTSNHCSSCHGDVKTQGSESFSMFKEWRASAMANAARDPYWQGSVRRETIDHPELGAEIQNECSSCHAPARYQEDKAQGHETQLFKYFNSTPGAREDEATADGVTCSVCHQIQPVGPSAPASINGDFSVAPTETKPRPVFGPFLINSKSVTFLHVAAVGYAPTQSDHIQQAGLCATCHTLYTESISSSGKRLGKFPEQMPYNEWRHSEYPDRETCQQCHMPVVSEPVAMAAQLASPRVGVHRHTFLGGNFFLQNILNAHRGELGLAADPVELTHASAQTVLFLQTKAARLKLDSLTLSDGQLMFAVHVENLTGHKLPTAYPSRRAWLHVVVTDSDGSVIFESGRLNADGSIVGNANDASPSRFSPHFTKITREDQVEIFEPILGDSEGHVTTGLLNATQYLKDNRILPAGFDKSTATSDIAVRGDAATDPDFVGGFTTTRYVIHVDGVKLPHLVTAELEYQPVSYRWAQNLASYKADEPQRFTDYYGKEASSSAVILARAEVTLNAGNTQ